MTAIAAGFKKYFAYYYTYENELIYDLIPRKFVTNSDEAGCVPHNDLFMKNTKIGEIFFTNKKFEFDKGWLILLNRYPEELLYVMYSLIKLRLYMATEVKDKIIIAIFGIRELDNKTKRTNLWGECKLPKQW